MVCTWEEDVIRFGDIPARTRCMNAKLKITYTKIIMDQFYQSMTTNLDPCTKKTQNGAHVVFNLEHRYDDMRMMQGHVVQCSF